MLWICFRPVKIIAVHQRNEFSDVLLNKFPVSDKGKISWWFKNKDRLKKTYDIPKSAPDGSFTITFWLFGEGYKKYRYDELCFEDLKQKNNCIEKNAVFAVHNYNGNRTLFTVYDGTYLLQKDGKVVKYEYQ